MQAKLTVELEQTLIKRAEHYAEVSGKSVLQLVADYFTQLGEPLDEEALPPITRALSGALKDVDADKADYYKHLEQKHT